MRRGLVALCLSAMLWSGPSRAGAQEDLGIPVPDTGATLSARLCRPDGTAPDGAAPARLVVINHG